jgi:hypothetical protein
MIESLARADITDPAEAKDMTEPAEAAEATEKADPSEPIDPIEANEPTDPIDSIEPFDAMERKESSDQRESESCEGALSEAKSNPFSAGDLTARERRPPSARTAPGEPRPSHRPAH